MKNSIKKGISALFFPALLFTPATFVKAQSGLPESGKILKEGIEAYDNDNYKDAIAWYKQIPPGDTNYTAATYELTLAYLADSSFEKAQQTARRGLELPDADRRGFMLCIAHAYDYLGKSDSALSIYDEVARKNSNDHQPYYEKGVVYMNRKNYDTAEAYFQKALLINPYHFRSHQLLGSCYALQGRLTESWIAYMCSLLITNNFNLAKKPIALMDDLARQTDDFRNAYLERDSRYSNPSYEDIDQIINAKLALDKSYKVNSALEDERIVRVAHAVMEKLRFNKNDKSFVMQFYAPLLQEISDKKLFDPFMLLLFSGYDLPSIEKLAKKQKGDMAQIKDIAFPYINKILATRTLDYNARQNARLRYRFEAAGEIYMVANFKDMETLDAGPTEIYKGQYLAAKGNHNKEGKKEGTWSYYYPNGNMKMEEQYKNGKITGDTKEWYQNGQIKALHRYNDKEESVYEMNYNQHGLPDNDLKLISDAEVEKTSYYSGGQKRITIRLSKKGYVPGKYKAWHENGQVAKNMEIANNDLTGAYTEYYENGQVYVRANYKNGKLNGPYESFYENGKKYETATYTDGKRTGLYESFDDEGHQVSKSEYQNGKLNGADYWFDQGKQYGVVNYKNDEPVSYKFSDAAGKTIEEKNGPISLLKVYNINGNLRSEMPYKNGNINGKVKYYFFSGPLQETGIFEDGKRNGFNETFYKNGKTNYSSSYKDGERTGTYKSYHNNGRPKGEGWLTEDNRYGVWKFYYMNGKIEDEYFYDNNELEGPNHSYNINGELTYTDWYFEHVMYKTVQYDSTGKKFFQQDFPAGNGIYKRLFTSTRTTMLECPISNGYLNGTFKRYYPDGSVAEAGYYKMGSLDSLFVSYFPNGKEIAHGSYRNGKRTGKWSYYNELGELEKEEFMTNGEQEGKELFYAAGELRYENNIHHDKREGMQRIYGDNNKLAGVLYYSKDNLLGYSYEDKDGNLLPMIPLKNGTGKVTCSYRDGKRSMDFSYKNGTQDNEIVLYLSNGQPAEVRTLKNGDYNGDYKRYYSNGKLQMETTYVDDEPHGAYKVYDRNGNLIVHKNFSYGVLHGKHITYNPATKKTIVITYRYGEPVSIVK